MSATPPIIKLTALVSHAISVNINANTTENNEGDNGKCSPNVSADKVVIVENVCVL